MFEFYFLHFLSYRLVSVSHHRVGDWTLWSDDDERRARGIMRVIFYQHFA